ncbi:MAG: DUF4335 domain-containing protein [Cyanobacteria bacterium P01_E01_bin.34]
MPTTPISKDFSHTTCLISVEGKTLTPDRIAELTSPVNCRIQLDANGSSHTFEGDGETLSDLVTTINRYLNYLLSSQSQGTFSGSVAIRPLDAVRHRITLRQGNGVGQADLTTTQLYDLAESLGEIDAAIPQLAQLKTRPKTMDWYRRPAASIAALAVVGVGVVATSLVLTRPATEDLAESGFRVDESISQLAEPSLDPTDSADSANGDNLDEQSNAPPLQPPAAPRLNEEADAEAPNSEVPAQALPDETSPESGVLDGVSDDSDTAIPSEIAAGDINRDVEISNQVTAESENAARSAESSASLDDVNSDTASPEQRNRQLSSSLGESWEAPEVLTEPVDYDLTIAEDGTLLTAIPVDERAAEFQAQTPFAELPETSDQDGIQIRVRLAPDSTVTVTAPSQSDLP